MLILFAISFIAVISSNLCTTLLKHS